MKVLDVGCGDRPTGDVNVDLFFYGKCKNCIIGEAHHLPFKNQGFDKVYSKHCLEHLENPLKFFEEARRVLKKDGILECIYPNDTRLRKKTLHNLLNLDWSSAFKWKTKLTGDDKIDYGGHKWQLPDEGVLKLLRKAGFKEVNFYKKVSFNKDGQRSKEKKMEDLHKQVFTQMANRKKIHSGS